MRSYTLSRAMLTAEEFLCRVQDLIREKPKQEIEFGYTKETAAIRRTSMELTRVLAHLRQNR